MMTRQERPLLFGWVSLPVLVFSLWFSGVVPATAWAERAPESPPDAGPPAGDTGPPDEQQDEPQDPLDAIRQDITALQGLVEGRPPEGLDPQRLLGVDALDEQAVTLRLEELNSSLEPLRTERDELAARRDATEEPQTPPGDAGPSTDADVEGDRTPQQETPQAEPLNEEETARLTELELLVEREQLAVTFLSLPATNRLTALAVNNPELRHVAEELEAAAAAEAEAEATVQSAEADQRAALEEAAAARNEAVRQLAAERARVEALRGAVAENRREYAQQRERLARLTHDQLELAEEVRRRVEDPEFSGSEADALYQQVVDTLTAARGDFQESLNTLNAPSLHEPLGDPLDIVASRYRDQPRERDALRRARERLDGDAQQLLQEEEDVRWTRAEALADSITRLNNTRFDLLPRLSQVERERVMGLGSAGIAQLRRELHHLRLVTQWYIYRLPRTGLEVLGAMGDVLSRSSSRWDVLLLLVISIGAFLAITRRKKWWPKARREVKNRVAGQRYARNVERWLNTFDAIGLPLGILVITWLSFVFVGHVSSSPFVVLAEAVLMSYAWYRLALAAAHHFFVTAAEAGPRRVSEQINHKIFRTVQVVGLFVLVVYMFLIVSSILLGRGYLYSLVVEFFWVGGLPIAYLLLRYWRGDIFDVYTKVFTKSAIVGPIERFRDKYWSVGLLLPAFLHLTGHAVWVYLHETALRFDRTRRALAYLFRKRLERSRKPSDDLEVVKYSDLPQELTEIFWEEPDSRGFIVDNFPHLEQTLRLVKRWKDGGRGTTIALVGVRGMGKTTWLHELAFRSEVDSTFARLEDTLLTEVDLCKALSRALDLEGADEIDSVDSLVSSLEAGPRRLILLDHCQNLVLRAVDGLEGLEAFSKIMGRTVGRVVWVCSFSRYIWEHVEFIMRQQNPFRQVFVLEGWTDLTLGELIQKRMAICGVEATYDRMMAAEGASGGQPDAERELNRTRERFLRLLWDYTDGVPRTAMHYWLRSLVQGDNGTVSVGLFNIPSSDNLEKLQEQARFMLHAVASHENMTLEEAKRVLRYPKGQCHALLELLCAEGYIKKVGDRYRVTVQWGPEVVRFLRRKHLLYI